MKLRTLFCNRTALKKDITRFAPAWALYSVMLLLTLFIMASEGSDYSRTEVLVSHTGFMVVLNLIYGYINGQILRLAVSIGSVHTHRQHHEQIDGIQHPGGSEAGQVFLKDRGIKE